MADIRIQSLNIKVREKYIFKDFNFFAADKKVTGILAPSGFGKTTLLNWISGILDDDFDYSPYCDFGKISYVFQEPRLIPNLTVMENITLPLKKIMGLREREKTAIKYLEKVRLLPKKDSYPKTLSGGEAQRVSIARAFAFPSDLLLLDEPFQSLDQELKMKILEDMRELLNQNPKTVIFVSHNEDELKYLCETIVKF